MRNWALVVIAAVVLGSLTMQSAMSAPNVTPVQESRFLRSDKPIKGQYIVVADERTDTEHKWADAEAVSNELTAQYGDKVTRVFKEGLRGFVIITTEARAQALSRHPLVKYVEEDGTATIDATQSPVTWGLDRIDQTTMWLDGVYTYTAYGKGVNAYVIDTGIEAQHPEFGNRAFLDFTAIGDGYGARDCNGHGTHVAGTIGSATWGVAKGVFLHSVRVLDCTGQAPWSNVIAGVNWLTAYGVKPAVANMSIGGPASQAVDDAVRASIAAGITYVVAAGNNAADACAYSPAHTREAITVGATTSSDERASFSNYGTCLDIFAPGQSVASTWVGGVSATMSGTSMAAPHVTGAVALYLQNFPSASPSQVTNYVLTNASHHVLVNRGIGSPDHFLKVPFEASSRLAFYRYNNGHDHFYTSNWAELGAGSIGVASGVYAFFAVALQPWTYEGVAGYVAPSQDPGTVPLYRYFNSASGDHFYTVNWGELSAGGNGWYYEGIAGFVPTATAANTANLYRYFNITNGDHFYTTNWGELGAGGNGWRYEGVCCQVYVGLL